jgi:hypothetical protein
MTWWPRSMMHGDGAVLPTTWSDPAHLGEEVARLQGRHVAVPRHPGHRRGRRSAWQARRMGCESACGARRRAWRGRTDGGVTTLRQAGGGHGPPQRAAPGGAERVLWSEAAQTCSSAPQVAAHRQQVGRRGAAAPEVRWGRRRAAEPGLAMLSQATVQDGCIAQLAARSVAPLPLRRGRKSGTAFPSQVTHRCRTAAIRGDLCAHIPQAACASRRVVAVGVAHGAGPCARGRQGAWPALAPTRTLCALLLTLAVAGVQEGLKAYFKAKIEEAELAVRNKSQNLRRLEAQRNELNTKGTPLTHSPGCAAVRGAQLARSWLVETRR